MVFYVGESYCFCINQYDFRNINKPFQSEVCSYKLHEYYQHIRHLFVYLSDIENAKIKLEHQNGKKKKKFSNIAILLKIFFA